MAVRIPGCLPHVHLVLPRCSSATLSHRPHPLHLLSSTQSHFSHLVLLSWRISLRFSLLLPWGRGLHHDWTGRRTPLLDKLGRSAGQWSFWPLQYFPGRGKAKSQWLVVETSRQLLQEECFITLKLFRWRWDQMKASRLFSDKNSE